MGREGAFTLWCRRLHSMISGAWAACSSFGQNRKVNGHMCPIWVLHLQTSYQFLQHLEGPSSFCMFCRKVADLVCWALRTHRTACNTAKPVNEALKSKSCAPFTYHSHVFTSFVIAYNSHLSISYVGKSRKFRTKTRRPCASSSAHRLTGRLVNPSLGHRDTPSHDVNTSWCDVNVIHMMCHWPIDGPIDLSNLSMDLSRFCLSPTTYKFEVKSLCRARAQPTLLAVFAWKSLKKTCQSRVKSQGDLDLRLALCQRMPPERTFLHRCKEVICRI